MDTETISQDEVISRGKPRKKHFLKVRYALKSWLGRLLLYFLSLAILFEGMALAQRWFVRRQLYRTADQELASWAGQVSKEVDYQEKWDLRGLRNAVITIPSWYIITEDGVTVDIEGDLAIFGRATPISESIYDSPQTVVSTTGETWRLFGKTLAGGIVIVGISLPDNITEADEYLRKNIVKFGSTIKKAISVRTRDIDSDVDYAVLTSDGEITNAYGGIPLKTSLRISPGLDKCTTINANAHSYRIYFQPIMDKTEKIVGMIIVPKDMTFEEQALNIQNRFNASLVLVALALAVCLTFLVFMREVIKRSKTVTVEEALRIGETKTIEFKGSFQWDINLGQQNKELRLAVLKSIAGFLNSEGGTLFIGVAEDKTRTLTMRGVGDDLHLLGNSRDKLQLTLRHLITEMIGSEFAPFISERFEEVRELCFLIVTVIPAPAPAWVHWKGKTSFYVREGPKTSDLDSENTWRYIKNKWH